MINGYETLNSGEQQHDVRGFMGWDELKKVPFGGNNQFNGHEGNQGQFETALISAVDILNDINRFRNSISHVLFSNGITLNSKQLSQL